MSSRMARRQEMERQERKDSILAAARKVFFSKGYLNATIRDIALEASLSPGLIYHYFAGKDDVYGAICEEAFHLLITELSKPELIKATIRESMAALARSYVSFYRNHSEYFDIISFRDLGFKKVDLSPEIRDRLNLLSLKALEPIKLLVEQGVTDGVIRPADNSWEAALALWAPIEGLLFIHKRGYLDNFSLDLDRLVDLELAAILDGVTG
ncbi:MAG: TetR/AcrR family transcriptional regulator [Pseudomonadota bacterium]